MSKYGGLIFIGGVAVGAVGTFFYVRARYKAYYEEKYNRDMQIIKDYYEGTASSEGPKEASGGTKEIDDGEIKIDIPAASGVSEERVDTYSTNYGKYFDESVDEHGSLEAEDPEEPVVDDIDEDDLAEIESPKEDEPPRIITEDEYADPEATNEQETLIFYIEDDKVVNYVTHDLIDSDYSIGVANKLAIKQSAKATGKLEFYVRNSSEGKDYCIIADERSYEEMEKGYTLGFEYEQTV